MAGSPLFAWLYARVEPRMRPGMAPVRQALLGDLEGRVLEIGCGTGANFECYTPAATVTTIDASRHMLRRARPAAYAAAARVTLVRADATRLPFADARFDAVVSTLVLCSVPSLADALREARRVLRPGGTLRVHEHVVAESRLGRTAQRVLTPAWRRLADGCHLDRDTGAAVLSAGFEVEYAERMVQDGWPFLALRARRPD